jgi:hypothetical protein
MKTLTTFLIVLLGISVLMSGCDNKSNHTDALSAKINYSPCWVYLNRQALGGNSSYEIPGIGFDSYGAIDGTLKQVTKEWIVLEHEVIETKMKMTLWIPRNVILCVRTDLKKIVQ